MLSDARELASDQQLDAYVYIVRPGAAGIRIVRELSGNRASIYLMGNRASIYLMNVRPGIRCFGWLFQSTQLDSCTELDSCADARAVGGIRPFDYDGRCWPDLALGRRHAPRVSRQAHVHGRSNRTLLAVPLADHLKKQLAD